MVMQDFLSALKYRLSIKFFILNNKQLVVIMQEQKVEGYPNWQTELYCYDFADYAEHSGVAGIKVTEPNELEGAVNNALSLNKKVIVDIDTDPKRFF